MSRSDRQKASDVFNNASYAFSSKASFEEVFPEVESHTVRVTESTYGGEKPAYWSGGEFADCSNPLCFNGGVAVGRLIKSMVSDRQTDATFTRLCQGYEGSPKGKRRYRSCIHSFEVVVHLDYRAADDEGKDAPSEGESGAGTGESQG
jgi:hypothetical protein